MIENPQKFILVELKSIRKLQFVVSILTFSHFSILAPLDTFVKKIQQWTTFFLQKIRQLNSNPRELFLSINFYVVYFSQNFYYSWWSCFNEDYCFVHRKESGQAKPGRNDMNNRNIIAKLWVFLCFTSQFFSPLFYRTRIHRTITMRVEKYFFWLPFWPQCKKQQSSVLQRAGN